MKNKIKKIILSLLAVLFCAIPTYALASGKIEFGDIFRARNITTNGEFADSTTATCGQTVQFRVRIHNPGPDPLENVSVVAAPLSTAEATSFTSSVTVNAANLGDQEAVTDTASVNLDKAGTIAYVPGSTELLDHNGGVMQALGDGIFTSGVNIGSVGVSTQQKRFVQFKAVINCQETPPENCDVPGKEHLDKDDPDCKEDVVEPEYICNALNVQKTGRTEFQFTTDYSIKNTTFSNITYVIIGEGVNDTKVSNASDGGLYYNQIIPGTYTVKATLNTTDGKSTSVGCTKTFTVEEEEVPAEAVCRILTADKTSIKAGESVNFRVYPEYNGNVTVDSTRMDFGDGEKSGPLSVVNYTHKYGTAGSYTAKAYINFTVDGDAQNDTTSANCELPITVTADEEEKCDVPGKEHLPKDDPNCKEEVEMCDVPGFENLPKDDPRCMTPEDKCDVPGKEYLPKNDPNCVSDKIDHCKVPGKEYLPANDPSCVNGNGTITGGSNNSPTVLPETGAGELFGIVGLGSMVTSAGYYITSRRRLGKL